MNSPFGGLAIFRRHGKKDSLPRNPMNTKHIKDAIPQPRDYRRRNGEINYLAWGLSVLAIMLISIGAYMRHHELIALVKEVLHISPPETKVVRLKDEFGRPITNAVLSNGTQFWEQNGFHEFAIEAQYRGKQFTVNQIHPEDELGTVLINYEPIQDIIVITRFLSLIDETQKPIVTNLAVHIGKTVILRPDNRGRLLIGHEYCNQSMVVRCTGCGEAIFETMIYHRMDNETLVVPIPRLTMATDSTSITNITLTTPDGNTDVWPLNKPRDISAFWCGKIVTCSTPFSTKPFVFTLRHNNRVELTEKPVLGGGRPSVEFTLIQN